MFSENVTPLRCHGIRCRRIGRHPLLPSWRTSGLQKLLTVDLWMPNSRSIARSDMPLRRAFWTAFHLSLPFPLRTLLSLTRRLPLIQRGRTATA